MLRLLHITLFIAGGLAIYIGAFAYNKGLRLGNELDDWWGRSSEARHDFASLISAFFDRVAGKVEIWLIRCFMEEVYSAQWIMLCASVPLLSCILVKLGQIGFAGWRHPAKLFQILQDENLLGGLETALWLFPIAIGVAFLSRFFLEFVRFIAGGIVATPSLIRRGLSALIKGDFALSLPTEKASHVWHSIRDAPSSWRPPNGLKAWVLALQKLVVALMFVGLYLGFALLAFVAIAMVALTIPLLGVWFGGLGLMGMRIASANLLKLPRPTTAIVIAAGVLPPAACLFTIRWIFSFDAWKKPRLRLFLAPIVLLVSSFLCFGPLIAFHYAHPVTASGWLPLASVFLFIAMCNGVNVLICYSLIAFALLLMVHGWLWPRLRHWLMALRLAGIGFSRSFYLSAGLLLVAVSGGGSSELWDAFMARPELYEKFTRAIERVLGWL